MGFIVNLIVQIIIALIISLIFSRPVDSNAKPAGISDFKFPTATQSRPIPVLWGKTEFKAPNCTWAGDFYVAPIKKKISSGFSSKSVTIGYKYHMGMQLVLCLGGSRPTQEMTELTLLRYGDKIAWEGTALDGETYLVDKNELFGGDERGGGIYGYFKFYAGSDSQLGDSYLDEQLGEAQPNRTGVAYVMWYGASLQDEAQLGDFDLFVPIPSGYVANSTNLKKMWFSGARYPNTLGLAGGKERIGDAANPACMLHELLSEPDWGMGWSGAEFNEADLVAMGETLYDEGFGLSMLWDNEKTIKDVLEDIMQHISGYYYEDKQTGQLRFGLMRADYDVETLDVLEKPTVIEVEEFTRSTWEGSMNEITISYSDPDRYFDLNSVTVNDLGNANIQNKVVSRTNQYHGIVDKEIAVRVGFRDLRMLSIPLVRTTLKCSRAVSTWEVGKVFKWSDPDYGLDEIVMRINKVERGDFLSGEIIITAVEDVFTRGETIFAVPEDDVWVPPNFDAVELDDLTNIELPYSLTLYPSSGQPELLTLVANTSPVNAEYDAYFGEVSGSLNNDDAESESMSDSGAAFTSLSINDPSYDAASTLTVTGLATAPELGQGANQASLLYINGELIGYDSWAVDDKGRVVFTGLHRGLINTVMQNADVGARVTLINGSGFIPPNTFDVSDTIYYKLKPFGVGASLELDSITEQSHTFYGELNRPYVLTDLKVNTVYDFSEFDTGVDITVTWGNNPTIADGTLVDSNETNQALLADTDYTVEISDTTGVLDSTVVNVLTGSTTLNTTTFNYADLYGVGVQPSPYAWATVQTTANAETSTYTALKTFSRLERAVPRGGDIDTESPTVQFVHFDGKLIGVKHGV